MEEKNYTGAVPQHHSGEIIDTAEAIELKNEQEAKDFFTIVKERLLHVNGWHQLAGALSASFQLVDQNKNEVNRPVQKGDYFKIDIPGPGSGAGDGFDWVQVEELNIVSDEHVESVGIRVRPVSSPLNDQPDVAHFYSPESTSCFTVTREDCKITAAIYDRNTKPNEEATTIIDKIRDAIVGTSAVAAFSKMQWNALANGLLKKD